MNYQGKSIYNSFRWSLYKIFKAYTPWWWSRKEWKIFEFCYSNINNNNNNNNNNTVHTDREVTANRPDIIIKNKKEKTCALIDVAIPADRNVVQKEAEKKLKYKSLFMYRDKTNVESEITRVIQKVSTVSL